MEKNAAVPVRNLGVMGTVSSCYGGAGRNSGLSTTATIHPVQPAEWRRPSCTNVPKCVWSPQRVGILLTNRFRGRPSSKAEQRFCKPICNKRPLAIFNGYKGFLIVSLGDVGCLG